MAAQPRNFQYIQQTVSVLFQARTEGFLQGGGKAKKRSWPAQGNFRTPFSNAYRRFSSGGGRVKRDTWLPMNVQYIQHTASVLFQARTEGFLQAMGGGVKRDPAP